jgi:Glycosyltransferase family 87
MANVGTRVAFFQGQTSFILLFILTSFFVAWKRGFEIKAGIWSSLAWFKPQIATVVIALTIVPVRWRFLWASAISTLLLAASSLLIVGPKGTQDFLSLMHQAMLGNNDLSINAARMHNLRALSISLLPHPWETYLWLSLTIMVGLTALKMNFRNLRSRSFSERIFWIMIAVLLVAPHLHTHDLTILIIPVAFFLQQCGKQIPVAYGFVTILLAVLPLISVRPLPPLIPLVLLLVFMLGPKILPGYGQTEGNSRLISFCSQLRTRKLGVR